LASGVPTPEPKGRFKLFRDFGFIRAIGLNPSMQVLFVNDSGGLQVKPSPDAGVVGKSLELDQKTPTGGTLANQQNEINALPARLSI
jgi:hypothetical protein